MPSPSDAIRDALADALTLLLPIDCAGCDLPDTALCGACRSALRPAVQGRLIQEGIVVCSGLTFEGAASRVIRALKEDGRTGLARAVAPALRDAVRAVSGGVPVVVVPIPTSRSAFRRRGYRVPDLVAHRAGLDVARLLRTTRRMGDQRGLDRGARRRNVAGAFTARPARGVVRAVVVDDVVTTGATLAEAVRALREAGVDVVGCATVAATGRLGRAEKASQTHT